MSAKTKLENMGFDVSVERGKYNEFVLEDGNRTIEFDNFTSVAIISATQTNSYLTIREMEAIVNLYKEVNNE